MNETSDVSKRYYVYILQSQRNQTLYIGFTNKLRIPFKLIHYEYFINEKDAKAREEFLKSGYGRKQLKEFLKNTFISF